MLRLRNTLFIIVPFLITLCVGSTFYYDVVGADGAGDTRGPHGLANGRVVDNSIRHDDIISPSEPNSMNIPRTKDQLDFNAHIPSLSPGGVTSDWNTNVVPNGKQTTSLANGGREDLLLPQFDPREASKEGNDGRLAADYTSIAKPNNGIDLNNLFDSRENGVHRRKPNDLSDWTPDVSGGDNMVGESRELPTGVEFEDNINLGGRRRKPSGQLSDISLDSSSSSSESSHWESQFNRETNTWTNDRYTNTAGARDGNIVKPIDLIRNAALVTDHSLVGNGNNERQSDNLNPRSSQPDVSRAQDWNKNNKHYGGDHITTSIDRNGKNVRPIDRSDEYGGGNDGFTTHQSSIGNHNINVNPNNLDSRTSVSDAFRGKDGSARSTNVPSKDRESGASTGSDGQIRRPIYLSHDNGNRNGARVTDHSSIGNQNIGVDANNLDSRTSVSDSSQSKGRSDWNTNTASTDRDGGATTGSDGNIRKPIYPSRNDRDENGALVTDHSSVGDQNINVQANNLDSRTSTSDLSQSRDGSHWNTNTASRDRDGGATTGSDGNIQRSIYPDRDNGDRNDAMVTDHSSTGNQNIDVDANNLDSKTSTSDLSRSRDGSDWNTNTASKDRDGGTTTGSDGNIRRPVYPDRDNGDRNGAMVTDHSSTGNQNMGVEANNLDSRTSTSDLSQSRDGSHWNTNTASKDRDGGATTGSDGNIRRPVYPDRDNGDRNGAMVTDHSSTGNQNMGVQENKLDSRTSTSGFSQSRDGSHWNTNTASKDRDGGSTTGSDGNIRRPVYPDRDNGDSKGAMVTDHSSTGNQNIGVQENKLDSRTFVSDSFQGEDGSTRSMDTSSKDRDGGSTTGIDGHIQRPIYPSRDDRDRNGALVTDHSKIDKIGVDGNEFNSRTSTSDSSQNKDRFDRNTKTPSKDRDSDASTGSDGNIGRPIYPSRDIEDKNDALVTDHSLIGNRNIDVDGNNTLDSRFDRVDVTKPIDYVDGTSSIPDMDNAVNWKKPVTDGYLDTNIDLDGRHQKPSGPIYRLETSDRTLPANAYDSNGSKLRVDSMMVDRFAGSTHGSTIDYNASKIVDNPSHSIDRSFQNDRVERSLTTGHVSNTNSSFTEVWHDGREFNKSSSTETRDFDRGADFRSITGDHESLLSDSAEQSNAGGQPGGNKDGNGYSIDEYGANNKITVARRCEIAYQKEDNIGAELEWNLLERCRDVGNAGPHGFSGKCLCQRENVNPIQVYPRPTGLCHPECPSIQGPPGVPGPPGETGPTGRLSPQDLEDLVPRMIDELISRRSESRRSTGRHRVSRRMRRRRVRRSVQSEDAPNVKSEKSTQPEQKPLGLIILKHQDELKTLGRKMPVGTIVATYLNNCKNCRPDEENPMGMFVKTGELENRWNRVPVTFEKEVTYGLPSIHSPSNQMLPRQNWKVSTSQVQLVLAFYPRPLNGGTFGGWYGADTLCNQAGMERLGVPGFRVFLSDLHLPLERIIPWRFNQIPIVNLARYDVTSGIAVLVKMKRLVAEQDSIVFGGYSQSLKGQVGAKLFNHFKDFIYGMPPFSDEPIYNLDGMPLMSEYMQEISYFWFGAGPEYSCDYWSSNSTNKWGLVWTMDRRQRIVRTTFSPCNSPNYLLCYKLMPRSVD